MSCPQLLEKYYNTKPTRDGARARPSLSHSSSQTDVGEDGLSEASDETLTNDTASVDTAHETLDEPQSKVADKSTAMDMDAMPRSSDPVKPVAQAISHRPESWVVV